MGTSKSTAYRTAKSMKDKGLISRTPTKSFTITSENDVIPFDEDFIFNRVLLNNGITITKRIAIRMGDWCIESSRFLSSFAHIIFNHVKRIKSVVRDNYIDFTKSIGIDFSQEQVNAYFSIMEH